MKIKSKLYIIFVFIFFLAMFFLPNQGNAAINQNRQITQVKTISNSAVYYLDYGLHKKKKYINEISFLSYGNRWDDIYIVDENFFFGWDEVSLVKTAESNAVYYIKDNKKTLIKNELDFEYYGFSWNDILVINNLDLNQYENAGYEIINTGIIENKSIINVKISSPHKNGTILPLSTNNNYIGDLIFDNEKNNGTINSIKLDISGLHKEDILTKLYLTDSHNNILEAQLFKEYKSYIFKFSNKPLELSELSESKIKIYANFGECSECKNNSIYFIIRDQSYISSSDALIRGSFPIQTPVFGLAPSTGNTGNINVEENSLDFSIRNTKIGETGKIINRMTITETTNNDDVIVKEIYLKNKGTARSADLANFRLVDKNNNIISRSVEMTNDRVIKFEVNNSKVKRNSSNIYTVLSDIRNGDGESINIQIDRVVAVGMRTGYSVNDKITNIDEVDIIGSKNVTVNSNDLLKNTEVFKNVSGEIIGKISIRNIYSSDILIDSLNIKLTKNDSAPELKDIIYIINFTTGEIIGTIMNEGLFQSTNVNIEYPITRPSKVLNIAFVTTIPSSVQMGDYYRLDIDKIKYKVKNNFIENELRVVGKIYKVTK